MFTRIRDYQDRQKRRFDEAKAEGRTEGRTEGRAEGRAEVYQALAEWNHRRLAAAARNEPFTEPFPAPPQPPTNPPLLEEK